MCAAIAATAATANQSLISGAEWMDGYSLMDEWICFVTCKLDIVPFLLF